MFPPTFFKKTTLSEHQLKSSVQIASDFIEKFSIDHKKDRTLFFQLGDLQIISELKYISTKDLKNKINLCLNLLKQKAPHYYGLFCLFNKKIRATDGDESCGAAANYSENTIDITGIHLLNTTITSLTGTIVHELMHFWQFQAATPYFFTINQETNSYNHFDQKMELNSFLHELNVLKLIGGSESEISGIKKQRGTHSNAPQHYTL